MKSVYWNNHYFNIDFRKFFDPSEWMITNDIDTYINYPCDYKLSMIGATYILHSGVDPDHPSLMPASQTLKHCRWNENRKIIPITLHPLPTPPKDR